MTFIVTLVALLIERFFDWSHLRSWQWFSMIERYVANRFAALNPYIQLTITILPILLVILLLELVLSNVLYGFLNLIFQIIVLVYCFGPKNLWAGFFGQLNTFKETQNNFQNGELKVEMVGKTEPFQQAFIKNIFVEANTRVFAVLIWYILLGPIGAILYRTVQLSAGQLPESQNISQASRLIQSILDWVPIRIFTFLFALAGHFAQVVSYWRKHVLLGTHENELLLTECGVAALGYDANLNASVTKEREAIKLLDRVFIIALVIIALGALIF